MTTPSGLAGYNLHEDAPGTLALRGDGHTHGYVVRVGDVHVVLRGRTPDTSVEISQHVRREHAIDALFDECWSSEPAGASTAASVAATDAVVFRRARPRRLGSPVRVAR